MKIDVTKFIVFSTLILMSACSGSKSVGAGNSGGSEILFKYRWDVIEMDGKAVSSSITNVPNFLFFPGQESKVSGSTGCNKFKGSFQLKDKNYIKFSPIATTKMACIANNMEPEFMAALGKINSWRIINDQLFFANDKKSIMKLRGVSLDPITLDGEWELNYISGSRIAFDGLYPDKKPTIKFNLAAKELGGTTSCNGFSSKIILNGDKLSIAEPFAKTMIFCEGGGENAFLAMLKKVNSYQTTEDNILSFMIDGVLLMRFKKV